MTEYPTVNPISIPYSNLFNPDITLDEEIEQAFGMEGIGLIVITDVPDFEEKRMSLLPLAHQFSQLSDEVKDKYVHKKSNYSFGWSYGKEQLKPGIFDSNKGSFYNNPNYDVPTTDVELIEKYPEVCSPNIWPDEEIPELKPAFKDVTMYIHDIGMQLLEKCDAFVKAKLGDQYEDQLLANVIRNTTANKARLLHYFPIDEDCERTLDSWCAWHNDHSLLTGLCPGMFKNEESDEPECPSPDPNAGLYVKTRKEEISKVVMSKSSVAFQIGLTAQVLTAGALRATPHAIRACKYPESTTHSRSSLAVFMQPNFDYEMHSPPIEYEKTYTEQFQEGMTWGQFCKEVINAFYTE